MRISKKIRSTFLVATVLTAYLPFLSDKSNAEGFENAYKMYNDGAYFDEKNNVNNMNEECSLEGYKVVYDELENLPIEEEVILFDETDDSNEEREFNANDILSEDNISPNPFAANSKATNSIKVRDYFHSVSWIKRNGVWSLSLNPKNNLRFTPHAKTVTAKLAWGVIWRNYAGDKRWNYKNKSSMLSQYRCHIALAKFKSRWNLEPSKKITNPITCN